MNAHKDFCQDPICKDCNPKEYQTYVDNRSRALQHWSDIDLQEELECRKEFNVGQKLIGLANQKAILLAKQNDIDNQIEDLKRQSRNVHN